MINTDSQFTLQHGQKLTRSNLLALVETGDFQAIEKSFNKYGIPESGYMNSHYHILQTAIKKKQIKIAKFLIEKGFSVNYEFYNDKSLRTPLHLAVEQQNLELVLLLLKNGSKVDINEKTTIKGFSKTPLHLAAEKQSLTILNHLVDYVDRSNIDVLDEQGKSVLVTLIVEYMNELLSKSDEILLINIVKKMVSKEAKVECKWNHNNVTTLHLAAKMKCKSILPILLRVANKIDIIDYYGNTLLHSLLSSYNTEENEINELQCLEVAKLLVSKGINLNQQNTKGQTPLHLSAINQYYKVLAHFLWYNIDLEVHDIYKKTILYYLIENLKKSSINNRNQYLLLIKALIAKRVRVDTINKTSTDHLISPQNQLVICYLIQGAQATNFQDHVGNTFLHIITYINPINIDFVKKMQKNYCFHVDIQNDKGETPMLLAAKNKQFDLLEIFFKWKEVEVNTQDNMGNTIFHYIIDSLENEKFRDLLRILIFKGASIDIENKKGFTPLNLIALKMRNDMVLKLIKFSKLNFNDSQKFLLHSVLKNLIRSDSERNSLDITCKIVKILLAKEASIDLKTGIGEMPLHLMIKINKKPLTDIILKMSSAININGNDGNTLEHFIKFIFELGSIKLTTEILPTADLGKIPLLEEQIVEIIQFLVRHGVGLRNDLAQSFIFEALSHDLKKIAEILLKYMGDFKFVDFFENNILHNYLQTKNVNPLVVKFFIEKGVPINIPNFYGQTPLLIAAKNTDIESSRILLESSADTNVIEFVSGENVVHSLLTASEECPELLELLISHGADINLRNNRGFTPVHIACKKKFFNYCYILIKHGADLKMMKEPGYFILNCLSQYSSTVKKGLINNLVDLFTEAELNVNRRLEISGAAPIHIATIAGDLKMIEILLNIGAKVDVYDGKKGMTPLHFAALSDREDIITLLLKDNVQNLNLRRKNQRTALHEATFHKNCKVLKKLIELGADVDLVDDNGRTALHLSCLHGNVEAVAQLLKVGADINVNDKQNLKPLNYANKNLGEIYSLFYKQVIMLQEAKLFVSPALIQKLKECNSYDISTTYQIDCRKEIEDLKKVDLDSSLCLYDLMVLHESQLMDYENNIILKHILKKDDLDDLFPIYSGFVKAQYLKMSIKKELLGKAHKVLSSLTKFYLSEFCLEKILIYLDDVSLVNLINASVRNIKRRNIDTSDANNNIPLKKIRLNYS